MKISKWKIAAFLTPCILLFSLVFVLPMLIIIVTSFFDWKAGGIFNFVGLNNYISAFTADKRMHQAIINTLIWVALQATIHVSLGTLIAYLLSMKVKGWKVFRTIYMIPNVISSSVLAVILVNVFRAKGGLVNGIITKITGTPFTKNWFFDSDSAFITVTLTWLIYTGLIVIIALAGFMSVPDEIIDAARIDGASDAKLLFRIKLPLIRTVLGTCVILAATSKLTEFELIYLTTGGGPGDMTINLPLYLYKTSMIDNNYGYASMMSVILVLFGVICVFLIHRIFRMNEADI